MTAEFEQLLRSELRTHMDGAAPEVDWAGTAVVEHRRHRRRWTAGALACLLAVTGLTVGVGEHRGATGQLGASPPAAVHPAGSSLVIEAPDGYWTLDIRTTADPAAAICLDLTRTGVTDRAGNPQPFDLCAPADPSYSSYHVAYVDHGSSRASVEFGRVPAGTTRVEVVGGKTVRATLAAFRGVTVWAAETTAPATAATAVGPGDTVNLLDHRKRGCQPLATDDVESPASDPCPAPTVPVESGYAGDETFCSAAGNLSYLVRNGSVTLTSTLTKLPANAELLINWKNNPVRGYAIASVRTTATGEFAPGQLNMFRAAEQHGIDVQLTEGSNTVRTLGACP